MTPTIQIQVEGETHRLDYCTAAHALDDPGLRALFDAELVERCEIFEGERRLGGLAFCTWARLGAALAIHTNKGEA